MAVANKTPVLREARLSLFEPQSIMPRRVRGHSFEAMLNKQTTTTIVTLTTCNFDICVTIVTMLNTTIVTVVNATIVTIYSSG